MCSHPISWWIAATTEQGEWRGRNRCTPFRNRWSLARSRYSQADLHSQHYISRSFFVSCQLFLLIYLYFDPFYFKCFMTECTFNKKRILNLSSAFPTGVVITVAAEARGARRLHWGAQYLLEGLQPQELLPVPLQRRAHRHQKEEVRERASASGIVILYGLRSNCTQLFNVSAMWFDFNSGLRP